MLSILTRPLRNISTRRKRKGKVLTMPSFFTYPKVSVVRVGFKKSYIRLHLFPHFSPTQKYDGLTCFWKKCLWLVTVTNLIWLFFALSGVATVAQLRDGAPSEGATLSRHPLEAVGSTRMVGERFSTRLFAENSRFFALSSFFCPSTQSCVSCVCVWI